MKNLFLLFAITITSCAPHLNDAQIPNDPDAKYEVEQRVEFSELPRPMATCLKQNGLVEDAKFYKEIDGDKISYEAKVEWDDYDYSIEYGANGMLEDIEVDIKDDEVDPAVMQSIQSYLTANFSDHNIEKIQEQYLGGGDSVENCEIVGMVVLAGHPATHNYELIVATKNEGKIIFYEMLFDNSGKWLKQRKVIRNSYDLQIF